MYYRVIVMDHGDLDVEHYCEMDTESADLLRAALQQRYPVLGVIPISRHEYIRHTGQ